MRSPTLQTAFLILTLCCLAMKAKASISIRILTHNIRWATPVPTIGEKPWSTRKSLLVNELKYNTLHNPESFICLQEVLNSQLTDILSGLNAGSEEWAYIGVGRDDGKQAGEYSPILYRKGVWNLKSWETVWLNENGAVGKKGWDAGSVRIVTIGQFTHVQSKKEVVGMCTHFDNSGTVARRESAKIILDLVEDFSAGNSTQQNTPIFLAGDFNSEPSGEAYQTVNGPGSLVRDVQGLAKWKYGNQNTWTDFTDKDLTVLDFIFVGPKDSGLWSVEGYTVLSNKFDDGVYNSDHRAVVADTILRV